MKIELPRGIYYVGDPCYRRGTYVFDSHDREWNDFDSEVKIPLVSENTSVSTFLVYGGTAYGDGTYSCQVVEGDEYPVDSGCIGVVKLAAYEQVDYGQVFVMAVPWTFEISHSHVFSGTTTEGVLLFYIPTAVEDEDENSEDDDWDCWWGDEDDDNYHDYSFGY